MPFSPEFALTLVGSVLTILPNTGFGWKHRSEDGDAWRPVEPPQDELRVTEVKLVQPAGSILGFTGKVASTHAALNGLCLMALTHTKDVLSAIDVTPLALVLSPGTPNCLPEADALLGYFPVPEGAPSYIGFGLLVPAELTEQVLS